MNEFVKKVIIETIKKSNDIDLKRDWGMDTYIAKDQSGKELIRYVNGWDYGAYSLTINGQTKNIAWCENDKKPQTAEQIAMFDILNALCTRWGELNKLCIARERMDAADRNIVNFLTGKSIKTI